MRQPLIHQLSKRYPLAVTAFFAWVKAKNDTRSYIAYLRRPVDELPAELLLGIVLLFFAHEGITVSMVGTRKGRYHSATNVKRRTTGLFYQEKVERYPKDVEVAVELVICNGFAALEKVMKKNQALLVKDPTDVIVGLDIEAITQRRIA